jgi:hypothetical protein
MSASMTTQNTLVRQMAYTPCSSLCFIPPQHRQLAETTTESARDADERRRYEEKSEELRLARLELARLRSLKERLSYQICPTQSRSPLIARRSSRIARMQRINYKE